MDVSKRVRLVFYDLCEHTQGYRHLHMEAAQLWPAGPWAAPLERLRVKHFAQGNIIFGNEIGAIVAFSLTPTGFIELVQWHNVYSFTHFS